MPQAQAAYATTPGVLEFLRQQGYRDVTLADLRAYARLFRLPIVGTRSLWDGESIGRLLRELGEPPETSEEVLHDDANGDGDGDQE